MAIYKSKNSTKDGRQYFFRIKYKDIMGITRDYSSKKYKTLKEVKEEEAKYRLKIQNQKICTSNITFKQAFEEYVDGKINNVKKQTILKEYVLFSKFKPVENIKINNIDLAQYKKIYSLINNLNYSSTYKNKILGLFVRIINYSAKYYNTNDFILKYVEPFKEVGKIKKEMLFFTYEEYLKFDKVIDSFDYHVFFEILYFLGLRQGECTALTWEDIDFDKKVVNINKTLTTKIKGEKWVISSPKTKNSIRVLPLTEKLCNDLKTMQNNAKKYVDYLDKWFVFGNSRPFAETTIQKKKNKYCALANVKQIRVHDFRHSCASLLINKGASISLVSKYLGHSNISITLNVYTHMYKSELENITKCLNNL